MDPRNRLSLAAAVVGLSIPAFGATFGAWSAAGFDPARASDALAVAAFAQAHPLRYAVLPVIGVVMHLAALVLVAGLHLRLAQGAPLTTWVGTALALFWITCDLLQNLVRYGAYLGGTPQAAIVAVDAVAERIWHAGHLGGGAWMTALALASAGVLGTRLRAFTALVGAVFFLHPFVIPRAPRYFDAELVLLPLWCGAMAFALRRASLGEVDLPRASSPTPRSSAASA